MLSRQPTFQLSDRVSHELKVICRLIDASVGVNTEEGMDIRAIEFPLGFWARQANFAATCSAPRDPKEKETTQAEGETLTHFIRGLGASDEFFSAMQISFALAPAPGPGIQSRVSNMGRVILVSRVIIQTQVSFYDSCINK